MSETVLQNGNAWRNQVLPFFIWPAYRHRPSNKSLLVLLIAAWGLLIVVVVGVLGIKSSILFRAILAIGMSLNLVDPVYLLAKGIYLKPGEKYIKPKRVAPEIFLEQVKKEMSHGKK